MRWKSFCTIFFTLILIQNIKAENKPNLCCSTSIELVSSRTCIGGYPIKLTCEKAIVISTEDAEISLKNSTLFVEGTPFEPDDYCFGKINKTSLYIICFTEDPLDEVTVNMNKVTLIISIFFLILTVAVYLIVPNVMDLQGKCIIHSISGLAIAYIILELVSFNAYIEQMSCVILAFSLYFFFLYAIFWQNVLSFHIWRTTLSPQFLKRFKKWSRIYHLYGISSPLVFLIILLIIHHSESFEIHPLYPGFGEVSCWFKSLKLAFLYFYLPIAILLVINIILYVWTIIYVWKILGDSEAIKTKVLKYRLKMCCKLFFIMGLTWIFEILSAAAEYSQSHTLRVISILADLLNGLEGLIIFIILVVLRKKVIRGLAERTICCIKLPPSWRQLEDDEDERTAEEISLDVQQVVNSKDLT